MVTTPHPSDENTALQWITIAKIVALPFLLSRLWLGIWVYAGHASRPYRQPVPNGFAGVDCWWLNPWTTYDSQHFLSIAHLGYTPETTPFFPLYPLLLRCFGQNELSMAAAGILLSNVAFFGGLFALYALTRLDYNHRTAKVAVWLLAFFPTSIIFSAVYSDALYFALVTSAFWAARTQVWSIAGPCAFLAALTRNAGAVIGLALVLEWWNQHRKNQFSSFTALGNALLPLLGLIVVQWYLAQQFGGLPGVEQHYQYGRTWMPPWQPIFQEALNIASGNGVDAVTIVNFAMTLAAPALLWWQRRNVPASYAALLLGILFMQLTLGRIAPPYTNTSARLLSTTFPFMQLFALAVLPFMQNRLRLVLAGSIYLMIASLFAFLFGQKVFVSG
jgi:hypothetical protein